MRRHALVCLLLGAILLFCPALPAESDLLYDVDFSTPPHKVGEPPRCDEVGTLPPRVKPTEIRFGDPTVVSGFGGLTDQPCRFGNMTAGYDQLHFFTLAGAEGGFDNAYEIYHIELDISVIRLDRPMYSVFSIIVDAPQVMFLTFAPQGQVGFHGSLVTSASESVQFQFGVPVHVEIQVDITRGTMGLSINGEEVISGTHEGWQLYGVRLHLPGEMATDAVAIDNFRIFGYKPTDVRGACCIPDNECLNGLTQKECEDQSGTYMGDGSLCYRVDCPTGACCLPVTLGTPARDCINGVSWGQCVERGGRYVGDGTNCGTVNCRWLKTGACCLPDGRCVDGLTWSKCTDLGGRYAGDHTACDQVLCKAIRTGACCLPDDQCVEGLTAEKCKDLSGRYMGDNTVCAEVECPPPPNGCQCGGGDILVPALVLVLIVWVVLARRKRAARL